MRWYDYAYIVPCAIIISIVTTPILWYETVQDILDGARRALEDKKAGE